MNEIPIIYVISDDHYHYLRHFIIIYVISDDHYLCHSSPLLSMAALSVEHLKVRVYLLPLSNK